MDRDIYEIAKTYGSHPSFAGFLQYYEFSVGYAAYDNTGYSNQTIANFTKTSYYQNVTQYQPFSAHSQFTGGNAGNWNMLQSASSSGIETAYTIDGSNGFYGNQSSSTTSPTTLTWAPKGGNMWQTDLNSNETFSFFPTSSNHANSTIAVTFNFQKGNNYTATEWDCDSALWRHNLELMEQI